MDANETDALFWRRLLTKYMARVSGHNPKMTDEEEHLLFKIEQEISYKPNEEIEKRLA